MGKVVDLESSARARARDAGRKPRARPPQSKTALVAALTANGVTPEQMMRVVNSQVPTPFRDINLNILLRPNYREFVARGIRLPLHLLGVVRSLGRSLGAFSTVDLAIALAEALPSGIYSGSGLEEYVRTVLSDP